MCDGRDGLFLDSGPRGCALARGTGLFHARPGRVPASRRSALGGRFVPSTGKQIRRGESTWRRPDDGWAGHRPHRAGGVYVNFLDADDAAARVGEAYRGATHRRLAEVKAAYDPDNVFHHNVNIRPASRAAGAYPS